MTGSPPNPIGRMEGGIAELFAEQLRLIAQARGREQRARAIDALAESVQSANAVTPFLARMVGTDRHGQRLALEIALRLATPIPEAVCRLLLPLLGSSRYPVPLRLNVSIQVMRSVPSDAPFVIELLRSIVQGMNPPRAAERLRYLMTRLPKHTKLEWFYSELEKESAIPCPRCGLSFQRPDLVMHLWQAHRLLMEGSRARDPWKMIEDWLRDYARTGRQDLLERSCELGQQLDPQTGLTRVHRLLLAAGLTDEEAQENLTAQAEGNRASLCPHCYALVPPKNEALPPPLSQSRGRISGHGCTVEVSDRYAFTRLYVADWHEVLHEGAEPSHTLTQRGSVILFVGPIVLIAFALSIWLPTTFLPPLTPVALVLLAALLIYLRMRMRHESAGDPTTRAIDHAWNFLVPELHRPNFLEKDAAFLASLAITSIGNGSPDLREKSIERVTKVTQGELARGTIPSGELAAIRCLEMDDAIRLGRDIVPILTDQLAGCLTADLPLLYGEQLLDAWPVESRDQGQRARLRVMLCARAFELGYEARDLQEIGRVSSAFGQAFASEDLTGLARLRWLWNAKPARVWQKNGAATSVFDLARFPALGGQFLESRPDLLLFQPMSIGDDREAGSPILICEEGVVYRQIVIKDVDAPIAVKAKSRLSGGGFDLLIGKQKLHFRQEPKLLARRLQGWTRFLFRELLPLAKTLESKRTPAKLSPLLRQKTLVCPECGNSFLALRGEVGILTDAHVVS